LIWMPRSIGNAGQNLRYRAGMVLRSLRPLAALRQTPGVFMTCTATCGNGSRIGMGTTTMRDHLSTIREDPPMGTCGCGAAAPGILGLCTHAHPIVTGLRRVRATRWWGCAWCARRHDPGRPARIKENSQSHTLETIRVNLDGFPVIGATGTTGRNDTCTLF
jgi:hypothetical protein